MKNSVNNSALSASQISNGRKGIIGKTSQLSQVLRTFEGLYTQVLSDTEGLSVEEWMSRMGVERVTVTNKKGETRKKGYTPGTIRAGWNPSMLKDDKQLCTFKWINAKWRDKDGKEYRRVYTLSEAKKADATPIKRYQLTEIDDSKWSVDIILKGLIQSRKYEDEAKKAADSAKECSKMPKKLCIIRNVENGDVVTREIVEIDSSEIYF